mmetsp:Transcript_6838/g.17991  ORF Transcript_6838/g.17991 Transcript_6838/m.17991 type:complete len:339 (-) Transcript_6838:410-1426(-)
MLSLMLTAAIAALRHPIKRVVVAGGTHGNEYTGVYVLERLGLTHAALAERYPSLAIETLLVNPVAHERNRRFVDADMNRMFTLERLADPTLKGYEPQRAKAISEMLGPKGAWRGEPGDGQAADLCIDMHTTTSNMGCTLIVDRWCALGLHAAAHVCAQWEAACGAAGVSVAAFPCRVLVDDVLQAESTYVCTAARHGLMIEVGPTAQGLLRADCVAATELALSLVLDFFERRNRDATPPLPPTLRVYVDLGKLAWPSGHGGLPGAVVHPSLQDADFAPIATGDPLFIALDGSVITYDGGLGDEVVPIFINEAAYYYSQSGIGIGVAAPHDLELEPEPP